MRSHVDALRPVLGIVFLAGYVWQTFAPESWGTDLFLGVGAVLFVISVPWSSVFHRAFALAAFVALGAVIFTGRFHFADFLGDAYVLRDRGGVARPKHGGLSDPGSPL